MSRRSTLPAALAVRAHHARLAGLNVFANDVVSVQTAEIGVMRQMLSQLADK